MLRVDEGEALKWKTIGTQIREARVYREMTQLDLAIVTDTSRQTVQNDERGLRIPRKRLAGYCTAFGWSLQKILDFLDGVVADELAVDAARDDYRAFVNATRDLTYSTTEREAIFGVVADVIAARYGVAAEVFTQPVRRAGPAAG